jgi:transcriptional regulator with XRE-family HTH domain
MAKREWLKEARKEKKLTLKDLASVVGCSFNYISEIERGLKMPSLRTAVKMAQELNFDVARFLELEETA